MQQTVEWSYYNHAIVPTTAPHEAVNEKPLRDKYFWRTIDSAGYPLLARWTTDFDCQDPTDWWYSIKDKPFDMMEVPSKYRWKIRKGLKNFDVRIIDPVEYAEEIYQVQVEAISSYPANCRPVIHHDQFVKSLADRRKGITFGAFSKADNSLAGYGYVVAHADYVLASVLKAKPKQEKFQLNAAIVYHVLDHFREDLAQGVYIMAGERNILHQTNCQDYMEKTFAFRRAYCKLHLLYRPGFRLLISCLYPMRNLINRLPHSKLLCQVSSVLHMEEIARRS